LLIEGIERRLFEIFQGIGVDLCILVLLEFPMSLDLPGELPLFFMV
jgi:hypothetical protein